MTRLPPQEGGLKAPQRAPLPWDDPAFYDEAAFEAELRRVADICHSCRRCFNLCASFPKLFDAVDASKTGEIDSLTREDFQPTIDACTLCDMCFMVKCPYVPPHPFNVDFPHLMLRARAIAARKKGLSLAKNQLTQTDRNGKIGCACAAPANWTLKTSNKLTRPVMEKVTGVDRRADLPAFEKKPFSKACNNDVGVNAKAPGFGAKALLYTTCLGEYQKHDLVQAARAVLAHNGVEVQVFYAGCCGMPRFEQGCVAEVAENALKLADALWPFVEQGLPVVSLVPSCTLMMAQEWPLLHPKNERIKRVAAAVTEISTYLVQLKKDKGLAADLKAIPEGVTLHMACHARAQNQGKKAAELLHLLPDTPVKVIERCSGHGGSWGVFKENFDDALKVGRPVMRDIHKNKPGFVASECPLAADHLKQGVGLMASKAEKDPEPAAQPVFTHPIQLLAHAWGLTPAPQST